MLLQGRILLEFLLLLKAVLIKGSLGDLKSLVKGIGLGSAEPRDMGDIDDFATSSVGEFGIVVSVLMLQMLVIVIFKA